MILSTLRQLAAQLNDETESVRRLVERTTGATHVSLSRSRLVIGLSISAIIVQEMLQMAVCGHVPH